MLIRTRREGHLQVEHYTIREVMELRSMTREQAIDRDSAPRLSTAQWQSEEGQITRGVAHDQALPTIARWEDVQRAIKALRVAQHDLAIMQLRAAGHTTREVAELLDTNEVAVRRRQRVTTEDIVDFLGGPAPEAVVPSFGARDMCLKCGERPRVRLDERRTRKRGGLELIEPSRMASVCIVCLRPELRSRVSDELRRVA